MHWSVGLSTLLFMGILFYTIGSIASLSGSDSSDMMSSILTTMSTNSILCISLAGIGYFSINQSPLLKSPYIFVVLHITLILSLIGFYIATLRSLGISPSDIHDLPSDKTGGTDAPSLTDIQNLGISGFAFGFVAFLISIFLLFMCFCKK